MISIVVPLHNHLHESREMLQSLRASLAHRTDCEIVLVDDASRDDTPGWLDEVEGPGVRTARHATNRGYAAAINTGARLASGEVLVLANNDLLFRPGWLEPLVDVVLDPARGAGLVGNVQLRVADGSVDHAGMDLNYRGQFEHLRTVPPEAPVLECFAVTGACCAVRRALFLQTGGLDEAYRNGCEDVDLCLRLARAGRRQYVATASVVLHHVSLSRGADDRQNERNSARLFATWHEPILQRLAARWERLLATGQALAPADGAEATAPVPADGERAALRIAATLLARNAAHRQRLLAGTAAAARVAPLTMAPAPAPAALAGYWHLRATTTLRLPAGAGLDGIHLHGHLYTRPADRERPPHLRIRMTLNGLQIRTLELPPADFCVHIDQPLAWLDAPSTLELALDAAGAHGWQPVPAGDPAWGDVYLQRLVVDGADVSLGVQEPA